MHASAMLATSLTLPLLAGCIGSDSGGGPYATLESAYLYYDELCQRWDECGIEDEQSCLERNGEDEPLVREAIERAGLDAGERNACRNAIKRVDACTLTLSCQEMDDGPSFGVSGDEVFCEHYDPEGSAPCTGNEPCYDETYAFYEACGPIQEALDELYASGTDSSD